MDRADLIDSQWFTAGAGILAAGHAGSTTEGRFREAEMLSWRSAALPKEGLSVTVSGRDEACSV
jgi:hypothetical protein